MGTLVDHFRNATVADSNTEHNISTFAHRASLSHQHKATERSENATSSRVQPITHYHAYQKYTDAYNGYLRILNLQQWSFPLFSQMTLL